MEKDSVITREFNAIQAALEALEPLDQTQRQFAVSMILARLGMTAAPALAVNLGDAGLGCGTSTGVGPRPSGGLDSGAGLSGVSVKDFLRQKAPTTDRERFICLAYYLTHARNTSTFSTKDITKLNRDAHGPDFSNAAATAMNCAKQSKFLSVAGGGKKRITTLGEDVVAALPDHLRVKEVLAAAPRRRKGKGQSAKRKPRK